MDADTAAVITAYATSVLAVATLALFTVTFFLVRSTGEYVKLTHDLSEEAKRARQDTFRPILMPIDLGQYIRNSYAPSRTVSDHPHDLYQAVQNVGFGPAINIRARLEGSRKDEQTGKCTGCVIFDESRGYIPDLPASKKDKITTDGAYPGQPKDAQDIEIQVGAVLILVCDDIFGRHFRSFHRRTPEQWLSLGHEEIKDRPALVRPSTIL